jgi:hypothetical protein
MARASIAIFPRKLEYSDNRTRPEVPDEVFEVALRVAENKDGCEIVRSKSGLYVVAYSENGPSKRREGWEEWLPVYVAKVSTWASGGIQEAEMQAFLESKEKENEEVSD